MSKEEKKEIEEEILNTQEEVVQEEDIYELDKDNYIAKLNDDLKEQRKKTDEYFEHLKRNMAEFDNFKKRMNKEKENLYSTLTSDIIESFLPILDNFEQAMESECKDETFKEGMVMIYHQFKECLEKQGLEAIPDMNTTFDPNLHEAVMHEDNEEFAEKEIIQVFRKGYKLGDKVIRHSMVKVAN